VFDEQPQHDAFSMEGQQSELFRYTKVGAECGMDCQPRLLQTAPFCRGRTTRLPLGGLVSALSVPYDLADVLS
jgi:hypothetical protein